MARKDCFVSLPYESMQLIYFKIEVETFYKKLLYGKIVLKKATHN